MIRTSILAQSIAYRDWKIFLLFFLVYYHFKNAIIDALTKMYMPVNNVLYVKRIWSKICPKNAGTLIYWCYLTLHEIDRLQQ